MTGRTISQYRIAEKLGGGGMGVVYKAHDTRLDRAVALKFLPPYLNTDPDANERFVREAKAASALDHPNICTIYDIGKDDDGQFFIAMAYYDGQTLKYRLADGLSIDESIEIAIQIAEGLERAHEARIVHRDIKSANLMVTNRGRVKILDFGVAKLDLSAALTKAGSTVGTAAYMSPEQAQGQEVDQRTDLWALGVVLYEMLAGQRPFRGDYDAALAYSIVNQDPEPLREARPEAPEELTRIVEQLLRKDRDARYANAEALLADLRALKTDLTAEKQDGVPVTSGSSSQRRVWIYGGGVLVLLVLAALVAWQLSSGASRVIDSIAVLPLANLSGDPAQEYFADGMTDAVIENLGQIEALRVISRTSVMQYKTAPPSMREVGRALDVAGVVEGTVKWSGDQVVVTVRLIDAATDERLWSGRFERELKDVLTLQREVALAIAQEIEVQLKPQEQKRLEEARPVDPEAYDFFLLGRHFRERDTMEDWEQAITYFERSIAKDTTFAPSYAIMATSSLLLTMIGGLPREEGVAKARQAAKHALELDPVLPEAHIARGQLQQIFEWNWKGAEESFRLAVQSNPNHREAHRELGWLLTRLGRFDESLAAMRQAQQLDPSAVLANDGVAVALYYGGWYDQAIEQCRKTIRIDSTYALTHLWLGGSYLQRGRYDEAIAAFKKSLALSSGVLFLLSGYLGNAYAVSGKREEALRLLGALKERWNRGDEFGWNIVAIYVGLDEREQALDWLEKAYEARDPYLMQLKTEPHLNPLRSEPRFQALLEKMGLDE